MSLALTSSKLMNGCIALRNVVIFAWFCRCVVVFSFLVLSFFFLRRGFVVLLRRKKRTSSSLGKQSPQKRNEVVMMVDS